MSRTDAFKKISADSGRREGTVAANYYRVARKRAGGSLRPRRRTAHATDGSALPATRGRRAAAATTANGDVDALTRARCTKRAGARRGDERSGRRGEGSALAPRRRAQAARCYLAHLPARFDSPDVLDDARSGGAHDVLKVDARADVVRDDLDAVAHMPRCGRATHVTDPMLLVRHGDRHVRVIDNRAPALAARSAVERRPRASSSRRRRPRFPDTAVETTVAWTRSAQSSSVSGPSKATCCGRGRRRCRPGARSPRASGGSSPSPGWTRPTPGRGGGPPGRTARPPPRASPRHRRVSVRSSALRAAGCARDSS